MGREDRGGGDTVKGHGTGKEASGPVPQNSNEEKGGFEAIVPVSAGGSLPREVPTPPLENPWDRYDLGEGHAQGRTMCMVREEGKYTPRASD